MLDRLKYIVEQYKAFVNSAQYILAGATYIVPVGVVQHCVKKKFLNNVHNQASHFYHDVMTEGLFALSKLISIIASYTESRSSEELRYASLCG